MADIQQLKWRTLEGWKYWPSLKTKSEFQHNEVQFVQQLKQVYATKVHNRPNNEIWFEKQVKQQVQATKVTNRPLNPWMLM